jgi:hypothetical protein
LFKLLLITILLNSNAFSNDIFSPPNDIWITCKKTSECVAIKSRCGFKEAVNKRYEKEIKNFYLVQEQGQDAKCVKPPSGRFIISCDKNRCTGDYK